MIFFYNPVTLSVRKMVIHTLKILQQRLGNLSHVFELFEDARRNKVKYAFNQNGTEEATIPKCPKKQLI